MGILTDDGFGNDEALDWLTRVDPADGLEPVRQLLRAVTTAPEPMLDGRQSSHVLAAVELVAGAGGRPHAALPAQARRWLDAQREQADPDDLILATRALDLVGTSSALAEMWSQRADQAGWHAELDDLRMRLTPPPE